MCPNCTKRPGFQAGTAAPGVPPRRLRTARTARFPAGCRKYVRGPLLIAPRLVLCSRHGVAAHEGRLRLALEVAIVAGPRGDVRLSNPVLGGTAPTARHENRECAGSTA